MVALVQRYLAGLQVRNIVTAQPQPANAAWRQDFLTISGRVRDAITEVRTLDPPSCLAEAHATFLRAAQHLDAWHELNVGQMQALAAGNTAEAVRLQDRSNLLFREEIDPTIATAVNQVTAARCT